MSHKLAKLVLAAAIFILSLLLVPALGFSLFPESEKPIITIDIEIEPGSNLSYTDRVVRKVEQQLLAFPQIDHISANAGKGNPRIYYNEFQKQILPTLGKLWFIFMRKLKFLKSFNLQKKREKSWQISLV